MDGAPYPFRRHTTHLTGISSHRHRFGISPLPRAFPAQPHPADTTHPRSLSITHPGRKASPTSVWGGPPPPPPASPRAPVGLAPPPPPPRHSRRPLSTAKS